jgi:hypothetical protein
MTQQLEAQSTSSHKVESAEYTDLSHRRLCGGRLHRSRRFLFEDRIVISLTRAW